MPKTKPFECVMQRRRAAACIRQKMILEGMDDQNVSDKLRIAKRTFQYKMKDPGKFTIEELWEMNEMLKFSEQEKSMII